MNVSAHDIHVAYNLLLRRDADAEGLAHYEGLAARGMSLAELRDQIASSVEFKSKSLEPNLVIMDDDVLVSVDPAEPELGQAIAHIKSWEPTLIDFLKSQLDPGDVFVDVGANVGVMSFTCAAIVGSTGKVISFEPHPDNIFHFMRGLVANGFKNVVLYPFALSTASASFSIHGTSNGFLMPANTSSRLAYAFAGDTILQHEPKMSFIKIDVEGHEPFVLRGLKRALLKHRPKVLCEFNPRCLKDHIGIPPHDFATELFDLSDEIMAIEHDGKQHRLKTGGQLMDLWSELNSDAVIAKRLPDGMLHLDLFFQVR